MVETLLATSLPVPQNLPDHLLVGISIYPHAPVGWVNPVNHSIHGHIDLFIRKIEYILNTLVFKSF